MKKINFRIVELENHQVLISKDFDSENESYLLNIIFFIDDIKVVQGLEFDNENKMNDVFLKISDVAIEETVNDALNILK